MNKKSKTGSLVLAFIPVLLAFIFDIIAYFADLTLIILIKSRSGETLSDSSSATDLLSTYMNSSFNQGLMNLVKFSLFIIIFGWWYANSFANSTKKDFRHFSEKPIRKMMKPVYIIMWILCGYLLQIFVVSILNIASNIFTKTFESYNELIQTLAGDNVSVLMIISVVLFAPIGEELLFRGLTLRYAKRIMPATAAIFFQAILFGIYHGNLIQGIYAFLIGLLFGFIAYKTDSLIPSIILHASINISAYLVPAVLIDSNVKAAFMLVISAALSSLILYFINHWYKCKLSPQGQ